MVEFAALSPVGFLGQGQIEFLRDGLEWARRCLVAVQGRGSKVAEGFPGSAWLG